jgi:putative oxygen-independent coproporphyrinogen III oxidase
MPTATAPAPSDSSSPPASVNPDPAGFGIYLHWPFCAAKCPYCDFNSHVRFGGVDEDRFVAAFEREIAYAAGETGPRTVGSVFLGGGTPSLMKPATVGALLDAVGRHWTIAPGAEITLEANPSSVEAERFRGYRAAGVNRVSIGVQALDDSDLKALGRLHSMAEARTAIATAARTFDRFSFDLIYARPGQTEAAWQAELGEALALAGEHLSLYQLTIEPGTPYATLAAAGKLVIPEPEVADALYALTEDMTAAAGLPAYEVSNYAAPGGESRHNLLYWRYGEYVGLGPGAHGRPIVGGQRIATNTEKSPETWLAHVEARGYGRVETEALPADARADEALLMGLRIREGIALDRLARLGGVVPAKAAIAELVDLGLLTVSEDGGRIAATRAGRFVLNEVVLRLSRSFERCDDRR